MKKRMIAAAVLTAIAVQSVPLTGSAETVGVYEAEDAVMTGNMKAIEESGLSGGKSAGNFAADTDSLKFTVEIPADGTYNIVITQKAMAAERQITSLSTERLQELLTAPQILTPIH